jgi:hypothetical protein
MDKEEINNRDEVIRKMSYKEFKKWCNDRACDGLWGTMEAMVYIHIINDINKIKAKGLFKKKQTEILQEKAWQEIISK